MQQPSIFVQGDSTVSLLYKGYASVILTYVRRLVPSWEDAEDIVLEVFLAALEQEKLLAKLSDQAQRAWLRRVAHNKVYELIADQRYTFGRPHYCQWILEKRTRRV